VICVPHGTYNVKDLIMDASALVSRFGMSPEEERQFRLNLENKTYSAVLFDKVTYSALFGSKRLRKKARRLLTRDIRGAPDNQALAAIASTPGGEALVALAVVAGADPNHDICPLGHTIFTRSLNLMTILLDLGADPNSLSYFLWFAIRGGFHDEVELLVMRGLQLNMVIRETTPLGLAVSIGDCQFANLFLSHGSDPNAIYETEFIFRTPLEIVIRSQDRTCLDLLLQRGADPNVYDKRNKNSPFMQALLRQDISFAKMLLLYGADWRACDTRAVSWLPYKRFEWFVANSGYAPNVPAPEGESLLELVTARGDENRIKLLVELGASSRARYR